MRPNVEQFDAEDDEQIVERVAAVDVAKASGMVCTRIPHPTVPGRRVTKVWDEPPRTPNPRAQAQRRAQGIFGSVPMSLAVTSCRRENGGGLAATSTLLWS